MKLSCHCGNIQVSVEKKPETLTSCNCSICHRYASLWGYYQPETVSIVIDSTPCKTYSWGDKYIEFHHCGDCGCITHYTTTDKVAQPKVGVNFRMAEPGEIDAINIRHFDGADSWKFLD